MRASVLCLLLAGCRLYDPLPLDCRVTCGARGTCPADTSCREGFCRPADARGRCECRDGEQRPCGLSAGTCRPGVQPCVGHEWGACEGAVEPADEACNGLDDDCDGVVDGDIPLPPPCAKIFGVCFDTRQQCVGGAWLACEGSASYGPDFEVEEASCDGQDNDCDGLPDARAAAQLASGSSGPWFFLSTTRGFVLVTATDAGVELRWLSQTLAPEGFALALRRDLDFRATSAGDAVILASRTDAGVELERFESDGGFAARTVPEWLSPDALELSVEVAAARVGGQVQLLSWTDGGAPAVVGPDTDGTLRLSQTGETLAWSGGLTRTLDLSLLKAGSAGPLVALLELDSTLLMGVPAVQPGEPLILPDLIAGTPARRLSSSSLPPLTGLQATEHQGRVLLVGLEGTGGLWLVTERGLRRRALGSVDSARLTPSQAPFAALAWREGETVWAVRQCAP